MINPGAPEKAAIAREISPGVKGGGEAAGVEGSLKSDGAGRCDGRPAGRPLVHAS